MNLEPKAFPSKHILTVIAFVLWTVEMSLLSVILVLYAPVVLYRAADRALRDRRQRIITRMLSIHDQARSTVLEFGGSIQGFLVPMTPKPARKKAS